MNRFPSLCDVPHDLVPYASQRPATDVLDISHGMVSTVVYRCNHCHDGWAAHWLGAEGSFRAHLRGNHCRGRSSEPVAPKYGRGLERAS